MKNKFLGILSIVVLGGLVASCSKSSYDMSYVNEKGETVEFKLEKSEDKAVVDKVIDYVEFSNKNIDEFAMKLDATIKGEEENNTINGTITGDFLFNKDYSKTSFTVNVKADAAGTSLETNVSNNQFVDYKEKMTYIETITGEVSEKIKLNFTEPSTPELDESVDSLTNAKITKVKGSYFILEGEMDLFEIPGLSSNDKMVSTVKVERETGRILSITSTLNLTAEVKMSVDLSLSFSYDDVKITPLTAEEKAQYKLA